MVFSTHYLFLDDEISRVIPTYKQTDDVSAYLYQTDLPALTQFTICFWFGGNERIFTDQVNLFSIQAKGNT